MTFSIDHNCMTLTNELDYSRYLRDVSIILFINKIDLLEEKVNEGKSLDLLLDRIPKSNPYYHLFNTFSTYAKPTSKSEHGAIVKRRDS